MLVQNNSAAPVTLNLRDGKAYPINANGGQISLPDSYTALLDDNASTIALFNTGVLTALTDAGAPFPNFPTAVNAADAKAGRTETLSGIYDQNGSLTLSGASLGAARRAVRTPRVAGGIGLFSHVHNDTNANFTPHMQIPALAPYYGFRLGFKNQKTADITIANCKAASPAVSLANANTLTWSSDITFGGSTTPTFAAASAASPSNDEVPKLYMSDYTYQSSVARTDFPERAPLLQVVTSFSTVGSAQAVDVSAFPEILAGTGLEYASRIANSNIAANPSAANSTPSAAGSFVCPAFVEFLYAVPCRVIADCGDSRSRGQTSSNALLGWLGPVARLCASRTSQSQVWTPMSFSVTGQHHTASFKTAMQVISLIRPDYLVTEVFSANDTLSQAAIDLAWAETVATSQECERYGVTHVVKTAPPWGQAENLDVFRRALNNRLRNSGMIYAECATPLEDSTTPRLLKAEYNSGDNVHPTVAAYTVERDALGAVIPRG